MVGLESKQAISNIGDIELRSLKKKKKKKPIHKDNNRMWHVKYC